MKDKTYNDDINDYWSTHWEQSGEGVDISDNVSPFKFKYFLKPFLDRLDVGASVCEVGSGNCQWLLLIKAYRPDLNLFGIDLADESIRIAKKYGISVLREGTRDISLQDNAYDFVYSWGVIEHMPESDTALREQYRIAKYFLSIDVPYPNSYPAYVNKKEMKKRKMTEYEKMIEYGKFFNRKEFQKLLNRVVNKDDKVEILNNYVVLPHRLKFFERYVPDWIRKFSGHNIGAVIEKNHLR